MKTIAQHLLILGAVLSPVVANASLVEVTGSDGNLMVNDSTLGVTWADVASPPVSWSATGAAGSAQAWITSLNIANYGGYSNWTLATGDGNYTNSAGSTNPTLNQLGYLFWNELGNTPGLGVTITSPFTQLQAGGIFWSSTPSSQSGQAYVFSGASGIQYSINTDYQFNAIAVRQGEVIPLPASVWLMLSGLAGMAALGVVHPRRKNSFVLLEVRC